MLLNNIHGGSCDSLLKNKITFSKALEDIVNSEIKKIWMTKQVILKLFLRMYTNLINLILNILFITYDCLIMFKQRTESINV